MRRLKICSTADTLVLALLMLCACRFDASSMCRHLSYDHARHRDFVGTLTVRRSSRNQLFRVGVVRCRVKIYWRLKLPMQRGSKRQGQRQRRGGAVWYGGISWPALHTCSYTNFVPIVSQQKNVVITVSISQQVLTQLHGTVIVTVKATKLSTHSTGTFFCFSQKKCVCSINRVISTGSPTSCRCKNRQLCIVYWPRYSVGTGSFYQ